MTDRPDVHPLIRNVVIAAIWLTVLIPAAAIVIAVSAYAVRLGISGELTMPGVSLGPETQLMLILGLVGGYGFVVWMAMRETFGGDDVDEGADAAIQTAQDLRDDNE